jgi:predicted dehydrogenase
MSSRRTFIGGAGASIAYQLMGPKPVLKAAGPNGQVAMGFIGLGIRGSYLLDSFKSVPGVRPVAAADLYDGHLRWAKEATGGAIETGKDYRALLARKDIDAVAIATPDHWHARMAMDALSAGKHVYVEKPMAWSIPECQEIVEAEKRSGKLLMVGSQGKTAPITAKAREIIQSGVLGKVNMIRYATQRNSAEGAWLYPIPADASPQTIDWPQFLGSAPKLPFDAHRFFRWRCWWDYSGGVATDLWVHMLTTLHEMMNVKGPRSVTAQGGIFRWNDGRTVPDLLSGLYEYDGFVVDMFVNLGNGLGSGSALAVMGSEGTLTVERGDRLVVNFEPPEGPIAWYGLNGWPKDLKEQHLASLGFGGGKQPVPPPVKPAKEFPVDRGLEHYELFIQSLREGKPSPETAEDGLYAAGAAHLGNMAFRKGRRLLWDLATIKVKEA